MVYVWKMMFVVYNIYLGGIDVFGIYKKYFC